MPVIRSTLYGVPAPFTETQALAYVRASLKKSIRAEAQIDVRWTVERESVEEGAWICARVAVLGDVQFYSYFSSRLDGRRGIQYNYAFGPQRAWKAFGPTYRLPSEARV